MGHLASKIYIKSVFFLWILCAQSDFNSAFIVIHMLQQFYEPFGKKDNPVVYEQNICAVWKNIVVRVEIVFKIEYNPDFRDLGVVSLCLNDDLSISAARFRSAPVTRDQCLSVRSTCNHLVGFTRSIPSSTPVLSKCRHPGRTFLLPLSYWSRQPL